MTDRTLSPGAPVRRSDAELLQVLVQHAAAHVCDGWANDEGAAGQLRAMIEEAQAAWPGVDLEESRFVVHLARHIRPGVPLSAMNGAGLYLAAACLAGLDQANECLESLVKSQAAQCMRRLHVSAALADELMQCVRVKLLMVVGEGDPGLATYAGLGPLENWLGVVMTRTALNLFRDAVDGAAPLSDATEVHVGDDDPDLQLIRERYQEEFAVALRKAIDQLNDKQRALLRLNVVHGLGIDRLAALHGVSRTTAARWMTDIRQRIREELHQVLIQRCKLGPSEVRSLTRMMRSHIDASMERILQPDKDPKP